MQWALTLFEGQGFVFLIRKSVEICITIFYLKYLLSEYTKILAMTLFFAYQSTGSQYKGVNDKLGELVCLENQHLFLCLLFLFF